MMRRAPPPAAAPIVVLLTVLLFTGIADWGWDWDWDGLCVEIVALPDAAGSVSLAVTVLDVP